MMWDWFNCYLSGRHDYGKWCESGTVFLRCIHCGRRSSGWVLGPEAAAVAGAKTRSGTIQPDLGHAMHPSPVVPFSRATAS
jgi:hypothetical protein